MAEYQEFGVDREGIFMHGTEVEQRVHNYKHICPPTNGDPDGDGVHEEVFPFIPDPNAFTIIDDVQLRYPTSPVVSQANTVVASFDVFREIQVTIPASVAARVNARLEQEVGANPGNQLEMWIIGRNVGGTDIETYPSAPLRVVQGQYVRAEANNHHGSHTIHWHGIEPTTMNDGVGKHSFEIAQGDNFIYQFQPHQAGTFFFHCHKNTVLHFEMGMFSLLIVDPPVQGAPFAIGGPGVVAGRLDVGNGYDPDATNLISYQQEKIWVADDMDSRWHFNNTGANEGHDHAMQACDRDDPMAAGTFYQFDPEGMNLNLFKPDIFAVTGVFLDYGTTGPEGGNVEFGNPFEGNIATGNAGNPNLGLVQVNALAGQKILIRFLNASYSIVDLRMPVDCFVIAMGGIPLGATDKTKYSRPYRLPKGSALSSISARRFELIIDTADLGEGDPLFFDPSNPTFLHATLTYYDWIKGRPGGKRAIVRIPINLPA